MTKYRSLKDLPGAPTGTVWEMEKNSGWYHPVIYRCILNRHISFLSFTGEFIRANPDWFEPIHEGTLKDAVSVVIETIENEGKNPDYHRHCLAEHRATWPLLWRAIDNLRTTYNRTKGGVK